MGDRGTIGSARRSVRGRAGVIGVALAAWLGASLFADPAQGTGPAAYGRANPSGRFSARAGAAPRSPRGLTFNPAGPTPVNPAGPTPFNPAGPTPFTSNPSGAFSRGIRGGGVFPPLGSVDPLLGPRPFVSVVGAGAVPGSLRGSFYCRVHDRGFASEQFFLDHLGAGDGVGPEEAGDWLIEDGGVWIFSGGAAGE